jgi:hypothetical protein
MPRRWSSASSSRSGKSGCLAIRDKIQSRCAAKASGRLPPIGWAATLPVCRSSRAQRCTEDSLIRKRAATAARLRPERNAATTRSRKSRE